VEVKDRLIFLAVDDLKEIRLPAPHDSLRGLDRARNHASVSVIRSTVVDVVAVEIEKGRFIAHRPRMTNLAHAYGTRRRASFESIATRVTTGGIGMYAILFIVISYCARCWSCMIYTILMTVGELSLSV
jgi:hypothetical protein